MSDKVRDKIKSILDEHEIEIEVEGCGCCGSPFFIFKYKGEKIVDDDYFNFSNIKEKDE